MVYLKWCPVSWYASRGSSLSRRTLQRRILGQVLKFSMWKGRHPIWNLQVFDVALCVDLGFNHVLLIAVLSLVTPRYTGRFMPSTDEPFSSYDFYHYKSSLTQQNFQRLRAAFPYK